MESYGELLRKTRESKNLDLDTVARETSIIRSYLEGLEEEDSGAFPGEAYLSGFLKNYAEYLGLNVDQILLLYKNKLLQESPVPEGLLVHEKPKYVIPLIVSGVVLVVAAILLILFFVFKDTLFAPKEEVEEDLSAVKKYEFVDRTIKGRVYKGDQIVYNDEKNGEILLIVKDTVGAFGLETPVGTLYTELSEEAELDIDGDAASDLIVYVSDISMTDETRGAEVRILKRHGTSTSSVTVSDIPYVTELGTTNKRTVILEDNRAYPFTLNGTFRGSCVFRYKVDRHDSNESYFTSGEVLTMTASNGVRLWMSNGNTVKLTVIADTRSFDLEIGKAGQIIAQDIKWIKDSDGKFKLVVIELD